MLTLGLSVFVSESLLLLLLLVAIASLLLLLAALAAAHPGVLLASALVLGVVATVLNKQVL
jgi:hypothetical protein